MSLPQAADIQTAELASSFRNAMRRLATTVSIITCLDEEGWHGMTATAVTSVCIDPPAIMAALADQRIAPAKPGRAGRSPANGLGFASNRPG